MIINTIFKFINTLIASIIQYKFLVALLIIALLIAYSPALNPVEPGLTENEVLSLISAERVGIDTAIDEVDSSHSTMVIVSESNPFDQRLDTTDDVIFSTLNVTGTSNRPNAQFHNTSTIDSTKADEWFNITWDMAVSDEATWGFNLGAKSQNITTKFVGIVRIQGCLHPKYNGAGIAQVSMYTRVLINGTEARCLQTAWSKEFKSAQMSTIHFVGTVNCTYKANIQVQYRVNTTDIDFAGSTVFDNLVAASVNLERLD